MGSVFSNSHILKGFIARDIKGRFAGTIGGISWALINPVVSLVIYYYIFSLVLRIPITREETGTDSFFIFFLTGFFPWIILSESLSKSVGILVDNANLITKVVFPIQFLHAGSILSTLLIHSAGLVLFLFFLISKGYLHPAWLYIPVVMILQMFFIWGLSFFLSSLCVFFRDTRELFGIFLMVWFYATPIIYPAHMIPENLTVFLTMNPMTTFVDLYRQIILLHEMEWHSLFQALLFSGAAYLSGLFFFVKTRPAFGDVL